MVEKIERGEKCEVVPDPFPLSLGVSLLGTDARARPNQIDTG